MSKYGQNIWRGQQCIELITSVEVRPGLYNTNHKTYTNTNVSYTHQVIIRIVHGCRKNVVVSTPEFIHIPTSLPSLSHSSEHSGKTNLAFVRNT